MRRDKRGGSDYKRPETDRAPSPMNAHGYCEFCGQDFLLDPKRSDARWDTEMRTFLLRCPNASCSKEAYAHPRVRPPSR